MEKKHIKRKIIGSAVMAGLKIGLYIQSEEKVYVSPAVMKLCESDMKLMQDLVVYVMPVKDGKSKFRSIEEWIAHLISKDADIFTKSTLEDVEEG